MLKNKIFFLFLTFSSHLISYEYKAYEFETHLVHVVTAKLKEYDLKLINAGGNEFALRRVDELAFENDAIIAVNAGYFQSAPNDGRPAGVFYSKPLNLATDSPKLRGAIGWDKEFIFGRLTTPTKQWLSCKYIIGGAPLLLINGEVQDFAIEKTRKTFLTLSHARTAIGINYDGDLVLAKAEGHRLGRMGFPMTEWANFLKEIGLKNALNLDGGSASSMLVEQSFFTEANRPVGNILILVKKRTNEL